MIMRVMADTNVIISALLFPDSVPAKVLLLIARSHNLVLCEHIVAELREVVTRKRPDLLAETDKLLDQLGYELAEPSLEADGPEGAGKLISDPKDQPILNAAIAANVDMIVSGDKHFLSLDLERPKTLSPAQFWQLVQTPE